MQFTSNDAYDQKEVSTLSLKTETLATLRWFAVFSQAFAVCLVHYGLGFHLPIDACALLILLSAMWCLAQRQLLPSGLRLQGRYAAVALSYDIGQFAALLYLTGGLDNPFSFLLLAPVLISAATLPSRVTMLLGVLVAILATLLAIFHDPLPWNSDPRPVLPPIYLVGIWIALLSTLAFSAVYAFRVTQEARQLAEALGAAELVLAREHHLAALDGLAAAAAHELGTPLGTIAVVVTELERQLEPGSLFAADIALLKSQTNRCREILRKLTDLGKGGEEHLGPLALSQMIDEVVEPFRSFGVTINLELHGVGPEPVGRRNPAISHGLYNIVENAVEFASSQIDVVATWDATSLTVTIADDGPGFNSAVIERIGEPFLTSSRGDQREARLAPGADGGLGLGLFIAKTLLRRSGARLLCENRLPPQTGAVISIRWLRIDKDGTLK